VFFLPHRFLAVGWSFGRECVPFENVRDHWEDIPSQTNTGMNEEEEMSGDRGHCVTLSCKEFLMMGQGRPWT